jgi:hypothetical protein
MARVPVSCLKCGIGLGMQDVGASVQCWKCGCWIVARAASGDGAAVIDGLVAVGIGLAVGVAAIAIANALFGRRSS